MCVSVCVGKCVVLNCEMSQNLILLTCVVEINPYLNPPVINWRFRVMKYPLQRKTLKIKLIIQILVKFVLLMVPTVSTLSKTTYGMIFCLRLYYILTGRHQRQEASKKQWNYKILYILTERSKGLFETFNQVHRKYPPDFI